MDFCSRLFFFFVFFLSSLFSKKGCFFSMYTLSTFLLRGVQVVTLFVHPTNTERVALKMIGFHSVAVYFSPSVFGYSTGDTFFFFVEPRFYGTRDTHSCCTDK